MPRSLTNYEQVFLEYQAVVNDRGSEVHNLVKLASPYPVLENAFRIYSESLSEMTLVDAIKEAALSAIQQKSASSSPSQQIEGRQSPATPWSLTASPLSTISKTVVQAGTEARVASYLK